MTCTFLQRDDFEAHEARVCIGESRTLDDPRRERRFSDEQYLKSPAEMIELFRDIPEAVENTLEIARRCSVKVRMGEYFLPNYPIPDGMTMDEFFRKVSEDGLENRLQDDPRSGSRRTTRRAARPISIGSSSSWISLSRWGSRATS